MANPVRIRTIVGLNLNGVTKYSSNGCFIIKRNELDRPLISINLNTNGGFVTWTALPGQGLVIAGAQMPIIRCSPGIIGSVTILENGLFYNLSGKIIRNLSLHRESSGSAYRVGAVDLLSGQLCPSEID